MTYTGSMPIIMTFHDPLDSPAGRATVRLRYGLHQRDGRTLPVLTYRIATAIVLTRDAWDGYRAAGATIAAETDRERSIVREVLGLDAI